VPDRRFDGRWGRSSYSSWTQASHRAALDPALLEQGRDTADPAAQGPSLLDRPAAASLAPDPQPQAPGSSLPLWPALGPLADFPRGPGAGECLHRILERIDLNRPLLQGEAPAVVQRELRRAGLDPQLAGALLEGLEQLGASPFGGPLGGLRVGDLSPARRLHEMNFDLTLSGVTAADLASAFVAHPGGLFGRDYAAALAELPIDSQGFLTGSIDLVFRADAGPRGGDDRWWVLDWKSNWLGRRDPQGRTLSCGPADYGQAAMAALMASSHYPLQAHLYLVALHRYLGWRLKDYRPERHLGGYAYVFLRGVPGSEGSTVVADAVPGMLVERPPLGRILALDLALDDTRSTAGPVAGGRP
jgi:exodeoxyribonuclease V beta subunit